MMIDDKEVEVVNTVDIELSADSFLALKRFTDAVYQSMHNNFDNGDKDFFQPYLKDTANNHKIHLSVSKSYDSGDVELHFNHISTNNVTENISAKLMSKKNDEVSK